MSTKAWRGGFCDSALFSYSVLLRKTEYIALVRDSGGNKKGHIEL